MEAKQSFIGWCPRVVTHNKITVVKQGAFQTITREVHMGVFLVSYTGVSLTYLKVRLYAHVTHMVVRLLDVVLPM